MDDQTELCRRNWNTVAAAWVRRQAYFATVVAPVTEALLARLAPKRGETILEVAGGPGDAGCRVAALVGVDGVVVITDLSREMVDGARSLADERGLDNVRFQVLDAQEMDLPDRSFDAVCSRFGYMLMPDPGRALRETGRVLRRNGRLAFAIWGDRGANTWGTAAGRALVQLGLADPPDPHAPGPFALDAHDRLVATLAAGEMRLVDVDDVPVAWRFASPEDWWETMSDLSVTLQTAMASCPPELANGVRDAAIDLLHMVPDAEGPGFRVPGLARVILARPTSRRTPAPYPFETSPDEVPGHRPPPHGDKPKWTTRDEGLRHRTDRVTIVPQHRPGSGLRESSCLPGWLPVRQL